MKINSRLSESSSARSRIAQACGFLLINMLKVKIGRACGLQMSTGWQDDSTCKLAMAKPRTAPEATSGQVSTAFAWIEYDGTTECF